MILGLDGLEITKRVPTIQTTALLRSARILRRVLETWGNLMSLKSRERPSVKADGKLSRSNNNNNNNNINYSCNYQFNNCLEMIIIISNQILVSTRGVMANILDFETVICEFDLKSHYYVHF